MKKLNLTVFFFGLLVLLLAFGANQSQAQSKKTKKSVTNPLVGAWEMKEVHWRSAEKTVSIKNAQPGMFIFTPNSYSIMWTPTEEPRKSFEKLSKPTDEELKSGFRSVVFNAGSYEMTDSTLTTTAKIAKVPGFEGGKQFYRYNLTKDILTITMFDETYPDGTKPEWAGEWVTEFIMKKVE